MTKCELCGGSGSERTAGRGQDALIWARRLLGRPPISPRERACGDAHTPKPCRRPSHTWDRMARPRDDRLPRFADAECLSWRAAFVFRPPRSGCDAAVKVRVPGRSCRTGRRPDATMEPRMHRRSRGARLLRDAKIESWVQRISIGAFVSHQCHVRHRQRRAIRRERHRLGVYRDQRCGQCSRSERKIRRSEHC